MNLRRKIFFHILKRSSLFFIITLIVSFILSELELSWGVIVVPFVALLADTFYQIIGNNYLIRINHSQKNAAITLTYFNFHDSLKEETINIEDIIKFEKKKRNTLTNIELKTNRQLKLHHVEGITSIEALYFNI